MPRQIAENRTAVNTAGHEVPVELPLPPRLHWLP
jgi:hypothetical protein